MTTDPLEVYLAAHGIRGELLHLAEHTPTVESAARVMNTTVDQIVKSVLFVRETSAAASAVTPEQAVLVIANGLGRVDYRRVADHLGLSRRRLKLADADTVLALTGQPAGGVAPFGHPTPLRTLVDRRVLAHPEVIAGGGALDRLLRITPDEIIRVTRAEIVEVVKESENTH